MKTLKYALVAALLSMPVHAHDWALAYENDQNGNKLSGDFQKLVSSIQNGASIRLYVNDYKMMVNPKLCKISVDDTYVVCQTAFQGANDKVLFDNHSVENFTTNGERVHRSYKMNGDLIGGNTYRVSIKWFVHE